MAFEIERKFLVDAANLSEIHLVGGEKISQGYLCTDIEKTVRVRIKKNRGYICVKTKNIGIVRKEFEYEIPVADAEELLKICAPNVLSKIRYKIDFKNHAWELDIFEGKLAGLIMAEVELKSAGEFVEIPSWAGREVSDDSRFYNVRLIFESEDFLKNILAVENKII